VDRLADAAEQIARTEDLTVPIPPPAHASDKDEVTRLTQAFNRMLAALATARARQAQLVADAGHELRTPLTSLRMNIDLLLRSDRTGPPLPAGDREDLMNSLNSLKHVLRSAN
jgi:two-component system sensor histidine kinase MprB